jgi:L-glyceraldehyde 3-phosphate reductase
MLTGKYLDGIPEGSRATRNSSLSPDLITAEALAHVRRLDSLARARGQSLAQMALAWTLRDPRMTSALIGARTVAQLDDSLDAVKHMEFTEDELATIDRDAVDSGLDLWSRSMRV